MCSIACVIGDAAVEKATQHIKDTEYRGYDSSGVGVIHNSGFDIQKDAVRIGDLKVSLAGETVLAHTRWATHGAINKDNAQPIRNGDYMVATNGVVTNYDELKVGLDLRTDNDAEVIPALASKHGVLKAFNMIKGMIACVLIYKDGTIWLYRHGSPLYVSMNHKEVVSDMSVLSGSACYLVYEQRPVKLGGDVGRRVRIDKHDGVSHGTIHEIEQQREVLKDVRQYNLRYKTLVGCGSSYNVARLAARLNPEYTAVHASEVDCSTPCTILSQSGETGDLIRLFPALKKADLITNTRNSTLEGLCGKTYHIGVGPERGVAATKSYTGMLRALCGVDYDITIQTADAGKLSECKSIIILGTNVNYEIACEGALKIKELSYIHAEAMRTPELKHGSIALLDKDCGVIFLDDDYTTLHAAKVSGCYTAGFGEQYDLTLKQETFLDTIVTLQLLAVEMARRLDRDIDCPRHLAKSITV